MNTAKPEGITDHRRVMDQFKFGRVMKPPLSEADKERLASSLTDPLHLPEIGGVLAAHYVVEKKIDYRKLYLEVCEREARGEVDSTTVDRERDRLLEEERTAGSANYTLGTDWRVDFIFRSSDKRYVPAYFTLQSSQANLLGRDLSAALDKMKALDVTQFAGTYSRVMDRKDEPRVKVWAQDGAIRTFVPAKSHTDMWHSRSLNITQMEAVVDCFADLPRRGSALCDTLRLLED
jgi:hypothetical protein